ncbi:alpha/beta hydrolase [Kribbella caucasensis]|uniref:alpha/beta hydrolase n=1 Tax=Kribbella caucasensis TaxID=2512215 RepID=UPI001EDDB23E|nr:alpha/beta hydrolase [Kribbella sp. VKM Ac-2527]
MAALSALAVVASGCGVASRAQDADSGGVVQPGTNPTRGPAGPVPAGLEKFYQQQPDWQRCGQGSQCATITVPLDYSKPDGETIELRARKVPARDRTGKIGTLFVNPGGPGASGQQYAAAAALVFGGSLLRKFDIVGWDPRGVGESTPVRCLDTEQLDKFVAADGSPDNEAEITALDNETKTLANGCEQRSGKLLPHVSTKDAARDIDVLRGIVGDSELYYFGASYGTYLGATYAELFPKNVGRLVLDGAVDPSKTTQENNIAQAKGFDTALEAFAEDCAQRSCQLGGTKQEVLAKVDKVLTETDATPLPGNGDREVTQAIAVLGVIFPLYVKEYWPRLEEAVIDALSGNGARLLALADEYTDRIPSGYESNSNEVIYAVNCVDRPDITSVAQAKAEEPKYKAASPRFGAYLLWGSLACANWPAKAKDTPHPIKASGAKPIVVIGTTRDPATPYDWAVGLANQLDSGILISRDGDGHTGYHQGNECVDDAVESFLLRGTTPEDGLKC